MRSVYIVNIDVAGIGLKSLFCIINFIVMQMRITYIIAVAAGKTVRARISPSRGSDCLKEEKSAVNYTSKGNLYIGRDEITGFQSVISLGTDSARHDLVTER